MTKRNLLASMLIATLTLPIAATEIRAARGGSASAALPDGPDFSGTFDGVVGGKRVPLERQIANYKVRLKGLGFGGATGFFEIAGERSPIRFNRQQDVYFLTRIHDHNADPTQYITLVKAKAKKGSRRFENVKAGTLGISGGTAGMDNVLYSAERYKKEFLKIRISDATETGEFALSVNGSQHVFAFGID